jgi:YD repeat-containing protein
VIRGRRFFAAFLLCGAGLAALADPGTVAYEYDDAGRLRGVTATTSDTRTATYTYDAAGNRTQTTTTAVPTLQFSSATYTATEAGGTAAIAVVRSGDTGGAVSIQYSTSNGTAVAGSDYTAASGTLNWASGDTAAKTTSVAITNDAIHEPTELTTQ